MFFLKYKDGVYSYTHSGEILDFNKYGGWQKEDYEREGIPFIEPMGAKEVMKKDIDKLFNDPEYYIDQKLDGTRCILHIGKDGSRAFSRNVAKKSRWLSEFTDKVPQLSMIASKEFDGTILDGELLIPDQPCNVTSGTLNCLAEEAVKRQFHDVGFAVFHVFDIIKIQGDSIEDLPFYERRLRADSVVTDLGSDWLTKVPYFNSRINIISEDGNTTTMNKKQYCDYIIENGGEGVVFKKNDGMYHTGKKGREFQKLKMKMTRDMIISGFSLPTREYDGKFPDDKWLYWEDFKGSKLDTNIAECHSASSLLKDGWKPITKYWYLGLVGNIRVDILTPETTTNKMKLGLISVDKRPYNTVQCGECGGITDEQAIEFSKDPASYVGKVIEVECNGIYEDTGKLRHPRFLKVREDKTFDMCTWENHIEG